MRNTRCADTRHMVKSPISLPRSFSIGVSAIRPAWGTRLAIT